MCVCVCGEKGGVKCERVAVLMGMWRRQGSESCVSDKAERLQGTSVSTFLSSAPPPPTAATENKRQIYNSLCVCVCPYIRAVLARNLN